ncbi:MAG: rhodanese-like domain-containing protein [Thermaerobacter sp.]|nr:rhodanese-like domain-containing protein [Thermaerobacter sp.]
MSVAEAERLMHQGVPFVDVRPEAEYARGHIPSAVLVGPDPSATQLPGTADAAVVCVCLQGVRSAAVAARLESQGRSAVSLAGGLLAWAQAGLPWEGQLPT